MLRAVAGRTREGPTAGEVGVEEERLTQGDLHRTERVEPRLRHLGELGRVELDNLLAQRRVEGQPGLWWRLGPEMHSDTPNQEEHNEHSCQRQAVNSATITEYRRVLSALTKNSMHQGHQVCPSRSCPRVFSCLTSKRRWARGLHPIFTDHGAGPGVPLTSPGGLVTLARRYERVGMSRQDNTLKAVM